MIMENLMSYVYIWGIRMSGWGILFTNNNILMV